MLARIGKLSTAVVIYCTWQERNYRIFQRECRDIEAVMADVQNYIVGRSWFRKVKRTFVKSGV